MDAIGGATYEQDAWISFDEVNTKRTSDETPDVPIKDVLGEVVDYAL